MNIHRSLTAGRFALALAAILLPSAALTAQQPVTAVAPAGRPLSLDEAIRLAARESEGLQIARAGVTRAEGQQVQARSQYLPQVNSSLAYNRTLKSQFSALAGGSAPDTSSTRQTSLCAPPISATATAAERNAALAQAQSCPAAQGIDFSKVGFGARNQYTLGLSASQNVFTGGRVSGQVAAANAGRRTADIEMGAQRAQLALDVTQAYFDAVLSDRLVAIADTTLAQTEELLRQTQLSRRVGNISEFELLRATVTRDNQRPVVIQRRGDRDVAYLRLKQLLNIPLDESLVLTTPIDEPATVTSVITANAGETTNVPMPVPPSDTTTALRAPVRESAEAVTAQEGLLKVARADRLPSVALTTNYQRLFFPQSVFPTLSQYSENWTVGGQVTFPLFTGGRITGQIQVAQANLDEARARLQQTRELAALPSADTVGSLVLPDTATTKRAPVRESAEAVRAQEGLLKAARADRFPTLALTSSYQRLFFPQNFLPSLNQYSENWTIGGTLGLSIFSGGRVTGQIEVARANLDEARARLQQSRELAALDTRVALNQLTQAEAAFAASRGTAEQARRAYAIDQIRFREGISTQTDLTQSRLLLEQAEANRAQSARDLAVARARIALIRDLPINTTALGAAAQRASAQQLQSQQQQQQQQAQPQRAQTAGSSAAAGQFGTP